MREEHRGQAEEEEEKNRFFWSHKDTQTIEEEEDEETLFTVNSQREELPNPLKHTWNTFTNNKLNVVLSQTPDRCN